MNARFWVLAAILLAGCGAPSNQEPGERPAPGLPGPDPAIMARATKDFGTFRDGFLEWYLESHPVQASELGKHDHDRELTPMDRAAVQGRIQDLLDWDSRLETIPYRALRGTDRQDYAVLEFAIRGRLLDLEEIRSWTTRPQMYIELIASGVASLLSRPYAPAEQRLAALQSRLAAAPAVLEAAQANLDNPPAEWTQLAISEAEGLGTYLEALPELLGDDGASAPPQLESARSALVEALAAHLDWLRTDLLPRSTGEFRLGKYFFARKLLYSEHVDLSVEALDRLNEQDIEADQKRLAKIVAAVAPGRAVRAVMDSLVRAHPSPDELIPAARDLARNARAWTLGSGLVTVLDSAAAVVRPSPPYRRQRFAWADVPGPFETDGLVPYFELTNAEPSWAPAEQQSFLTYFGAGTLLGVTLHETFPGRAVQAAYRQKYPSDVRRVFEPRSLTEGWAQYAEQAALDTGFASPDSLARIAGLRRALEQHARWYATLHLHAFEEPMDSVVHRFMDIAYMEEEPARREVMRATWDPMYFAPALGRVEILELRKDYAAFLEKAKKRFSPRDFNDQLLSLGLPLPLAREALMPRPEASPERPRRDRNPLH